MKNYEDDKTFLIVHSIKFHIIRKLNPMNSPSTPPMSAMKESKGWASSSLNTCTLFDVKNGVTVVLLLGYVDGGSEICKSYFWSLPPTHCMNTHFVFNIRAWQPASCCLNNFTNVHVKIDINIFIAILIQQSPIVTQPHSCYTEPSPRRLAPHLSYDILLYTLS